jgi:hypothetical protein
VFYADVPATVYDPAQALVVVPERYTAAERAQALVDLGRRVSGR